MKFSLLVSSLLCGAAVATTPCKKSAAACNADNCARAVTGTRLGPASQSAAQGDCKSFLQCTSYPATSTVTKTATVFPVTQTATVFPVSVTQDVTYTTVVTTDTTVTAVRTIQVTDVEHVTDTVTTVVTVIGNAKRSPTQITSQPAATGSVVCPTGVPTYASACSGTVRYSSACSCFGVSKTTTAMTTPTTTVTVTATGQTTVTVSNTKVLTNSVQAVTTVSAFATVTTFDIQTVIVTDTAVQVATATAAVGNAYCSNGAKVNGLSPQCTQAGCRATYLRIEGASETVYEGIINNGPTNVTTASGGTHLCDGTNDGANPAPGANGISDIAYAAPLCGFTYDGTFSNQFDDFFISRIGLSDSNASPNQFWGILNNYAFTPAGGCETEISTTDNNLWAFNAFNVNYFLSVEPDKNVPVVIAPGQTHTFTVMGHDGNGDAAQPIAGASFGGLTSDSNGNVVYTAPTTPGVYRIKASRSDSIRSNAVVIVVQG